MINIFPLVIPLCRSWFRVKMNDQIQWMRTFAAYRDGVDADGWLNDALEVTWPRW